MVDATLVAGLVLSGVVAAGFTFVGVRTWKRAAANADPWPVRAFAVFWCGLALATLEDAALTLAALAGWGVDFVFVVMQARIFTTLAALLGLVYHIMHIVRGRGYGGLLALAYIALLALIEWTQARLGLTGVVADPWRGWYAWSIPVTTPEYYLSITLLWIPPVVAGLLYVRLARLIDDAAGRFRGTLLGTAIAGYFTVTWIGFLEFHNAWWGLLQHILGLAMALLAVWAMQPPGWARARLGAQVSGKRRAASQSLQERAVQLI